MKHLIFLVSVVTLFLAGCNTGSSSGKENVYAIIPAPVSIKEMPGNFTFNGKSKIVLSEINSENRLAADFLAGLVKNPTGIVIPVVQGTKAASGSVLMSIDATVTDPEGYTLVVTPKRILIKAGTAVGLFYAVQTIRQLLPADVEKDSIVNNITLTVPSCEIADSPRFGYRGMHLDVGRHLFPVEYIKRYIDMIALHKMNTFHWHLTEDQGWRIEIKKYPKLTEVGAFRKETIVGKPGKNTPVYDGIPYGGFYSQEEVRNIVEYAKSRFVTIIPEIEMPGHSLAAIAAYPGLSCTGSREKMGYS
jgi:hexosaminidase